ncbi:hypothetical protein HYV21_00670 [Candidatus Microgenomates bacterium]|nr:hypothetical protein [Candidatus Microgenomates bacterium]
MEERSRGLGQILAEVEEAKKEAARQIKALLQERTKQGVDLGIFDDPKLRDRAIIKANTQNVLLDKIDTMYSGDPPGMFNTNFRFVVLTPDGSLRQLFIFRTVNGLLEQRHEFSWGKKLQDIEYLEHGPFFVERIDQLISKAQKRKVA